jgi:predicted nucleic acid-binding protein
MILVDASVWIDHLRTENRFLTGLLNERRIAGHSFVRGEICLGSVARRAFLLEMLDALPQAPVATDHEVHGMIESRKWFARGIGYVDAHLLASVIVDRGTQLWTIDARLGGLAEEAGVRFLP